MFSNTWPTVQGLLDPEKLPALFFSLDVDVVLNLQASNALQNKRRKGLWVGIQKFLESPLPNELSITVVDFVNPRHVL